MIFFCNFKFFFLWVYLLYAVFFWFSIPKIYDAFYSLLIKKRIEVIQNQISSFSESVTSLPIRFPEFLYIVLLGNKGREGRDTCIVSLFRSFVFKRTKNFFQISITNNVMVVYQKHLVPQRFDNFLYSYTLA